MKHTYKITGMTCSGCQNKVQQLLAAVPNVKQVNVDLPKGEAVIEMDSHITIAALKAALQAYPKYQIEEKHAQVPAYVAEEQLPKTWLQT